MSVRLIDSYASAFVSKNEYSYMAPMVKTAHEMLHQKSLISEKVLLVKLAVIPFEMIHCPQIRNDGVAR